MKKKEREKKSSSGSAPGIPLLRSALSVRGWLLETVRQGRGSYSLEADSRRIAIGLRNLAESDQVPSADRSRLDVSRAGGECAAGSERRIYGVVSPDVAWVVLRD